MDQVNSLVYATLAKRALLFDEWLTSHLRCADSMPTIIISESGTARLAKYAKCICGSWLEVIIDIALVVNSQESELYTMRIRQGA